jgi:hypothetical protein
MLRNLWPFGTSNASSAALNYLQNYATSTLQAIQQPYQAIEYNILYELEEAEEQREAIFDQHLDLVEEAATCRNLALFEEKLRALQPFTQPIPYFSNSEKQGEPDLFTEILSNPFFTSLEKSRLILLSLDHGYAPYRSDLLSAPLIHQVLQDELYSPFVRQLYLDILKDKNEVVELESETERTIWNLFFNAAEPYPLFNTLMNHAGTNNEKLMQFIASWMNRLVEVDDVFISYTIINTIANYRQMMSNYLPDVQRIAKQRINTIELEESQMQDESSPTKAKNHDPRITYFLSTHRSSIFFGGYGTTKSMEINNAIHEGKLDQASTLLMEERNRLQLEINSKLEKEPGYHGGIRLG